MKGQRLTGPMHWHRLIARSRLSLTEKAVCYSMMEWMDWSKEGDQTVWPSASSVARAAGCAVRTIQRTLKGLDKKGVIEFLDDRTGGRVEGRKPRTNGIRFFQQRLSELNPDTESGYEGDNPDTESTEPRQPDTDTPTQSPLNPDTVSSDQTKEQTKEQTTTTKGGDDGDKQSGPDAEKRAEAQRLLTDRGVMPSKAKTLAQRHPLDLIAWAVRHKGNDGQAAWGPPGLLVSVIENGDARDMWNREQQKRLNRRLKKLDGLGSLAKKDAARADRMLPQVKAVWPTVEELAEDCPLSDEELDNRDQWAVLEALHAEALRRSDDGNRLHKAEVSGTGGSGSEPTDGTGR